MSKFMDEMIDPIYEYIQNQHRTIIKILIMVYILLWVVKRCSDSINAWTHVFLTIIYSPFKWMTGPRTSYHIPLTNLPSFAPSRFTEQHDFNTWIRSFETYALRLPDRASALLTLVDDRCLVKLEQRLLNQKPDANYEEIKDVMLKLYGRVYRQTDPLMEFAARRQRQGENIYSYLCELECQASAPYPSEPLRVVESKIIDRF
ncbi:hypothetical protein BpHYR1_037587, partial [Brachionus plicatilis]